MKYRKVSDHLKEEMKDPWFKETYELEQQKMKIVLKILEYRVKHKLSQSQLAKLVGVSQQHISKIENGDFSSKSGKQTFGNLLCHIGLIKPSYFNSSR